MAIHRDGDLVNAPDSLGGRGRQTVPRPLSISGSRKKRAPELPWWAP